MENEPVPERGEGLIHVECLNEHQEASQKAFNALVQNFLRRAPNCKSGGYPTGYSDELATEKAVTFSLGSSTITVEYYVDLGTPPRSSISIATPIIVGNLASDWTWTIIHPLEPIEYAEFEGQSYYGDLEVRVKAKTRPDAHGWPILLDQYTAGGLLPPIQTEGRGKLEAFDNLTALLKDVKPQNPRYRRPIQRVTI